MTNVLNPPNVVQHRRASKAHSKDSVVALDMFSGCGGSSQGIEAAGVDVWYAANHWEYAIELHERNHPKAEHFIADLVDETAADYYHPEMLPQADILWASPSCTNHSKANSQRAYRDNMSLFNFEDEDFDEQVTHSERSRATAVCVLQYARKHDPRIIMVENTVEFAQWGEAVPGKKKGDGSTFRWWIKEFEKLGYRTKTLFFNSMFFPPCPQSRDRMYIAMWKADMREPDLDFRPRAFCTHCDTEIEAKQVFKTRTAAWPLKEWGKYGDQYVYMCESCHNQVSPMAMPCASVIDWSDLGSRIGDREKPLAESTMARIARGVAKFSEWPSFVMPAKAMTRGVDRHVLEPFQTQTTQQEMMLVNAMQVVAAGNTHERDGSSCRTRSVMDPMWSQHTTPAFGLVTHEMMAYPFLDNFQGVARSMGDVLPTQAGTETHGLVAIPMLYTARGTTAAGGAQRDARIESMSTPMTTVSAGGNHHFMLTPLFAKQNGGPADTAWHQVTDPLNTLLGVDTTCLLAPPAGEMPPIAVEDCLYRMLKPDEIKLGMGLSWDFEMWGTARNRVKALGNAVTPPVAQWIADRMTAVMK